ncbi:NAD(P)-dependent oxidoreductase [Amycolatopsis jejuensis]|uniref:NAD(P)-dependent oxidoreductase n=1 Tax=Amycolatopsis jejuensis TaxID=330084 RepID=UPI000527C079|nr:NAD(P)-dependent oxidoreductase [Amycolatopsis jejuensis]
MTTPRIGFIGLGAMGAPMAMNLVKAGYAVTVFDLSPPAVNRLRDAGATAATTAREVGENSDVAITMLPRSAHVEAAVTGEYGLYRGLAKGAVHIDMSTIEPSASKRFAELAQENGLRMFDAPVGKSTAAAAAGVLTIMAGGDPAVVDECRPILDVMGEIVYHCGSEVGAGAAVKVVNNLVSGGILVVVAEAMGLGVKAGVRPEIMVEVLGATGAANWQLANTLAQKALKRDYEPGFAISLIHKDCGLGAQMAEDLKVPMPVSGLVKQQYEAAMAAGHAGLDWGGYLKVIEAAIGEDVAFGAA